MTTKYTPIPDAVPQTTRTLIQAEVALSMLVQLLDETADKLDAWHGLLDGTCPHVGDLLTAERLVRGAAKYIDRPLMEAILATDPDSLN